MRAIASSSLPIISGSLMMYFPGLCVFHEIHSFGRSLSARVLQVLDGAVALGIEDATLLSNLAAVLAQLGQRDNAQAMLERANHVGSNTLRQLSALLMPNRALLVARS